MGQSSFKVVHVLLFSLVIGRVITVGNDKLNVEVLYESLCPDSLRFITEQLHPVWNELAPYVHLKLVPFGKSASLEDGTQFVCQHGPQECKGNRIQSCALNSIPDQNNQVEFVNCFMKAFRKGLRHTSEQEHATNCARGVGLVDFSEISQCYQSSSGTRLQLLAEQDTAQIAPKFVPTIIYNGQFNQQLQDASLDDFRGVVCKLIANNRPEACNNLSVIRL